MKWQIFSIRTKAERTDKREFADDMNMNKLLVTEFSIELNVQMCIQRNIRIEVHLPDQQSQVKPGFAYFMRSHSNDAHTV